MLIKIGEETIEIDRHQDIVSKINELLLTRVDSSKLMISHLNFDGEHVYDNFEQNINQKALVVEEIEIVLQEKMRIADEIVESIHYYTVNALPELERFGEELVRGEADVNAKEVFDILDALNWLNSLSSIELLDDETPSNWNEIMITVNKIEPIIGEINESIEQNDITLLGDLIQYEVLPIFEELKEATIQLPKS
ncbi:hypothetical protein ABID56_001077 [Alkalibacillus flavidus]|uniref:Uncharacterized protein n=1 Tax=Alkalibacillus flavidus TaxID=546021 RepID=A0ABV2KTT2_9BACI